MLSSLKLFPKCLVLVKMFKLYDWIYSSLVWLLNGDIYVLIFYLRLVYMYLTKGGIKLLVMLDELDLLDFNCSVWLKDFLKI